MNLKDFCELIAAEGRWNPDFIAEILESASLDGTDLERDFVWKLMKEANLPLYSQQGFREAAFVALEIAGQ